MALCVSVSVLTPGVESLQEPLCSHCVMLRERQFVDSVTGVQPHDCRKGGRSKTPTLADFCTIL